MNTAVIIVAAVAIAIALYNKRLQASETYRAFTAPLASIMDIGFLAVIPLVVIVMGLDAAWFILGVVIVAYLMGNVIRFNIAQLGQDNARDSALRRLVPTSSWLLAGAYAINIAYYLQLLAVLTLALFDESNKAATNWLATIVLVAIGAVGVTAGLVRLNVLGERTVPLNLAIIGAFLVGLIYFNVDALITDTWLVPDLPGKSDFTSIRKVLGTLVIVQGFEISLYLGNLYPKDLRIRTTRYAQIASGIVFVATFGLLTILFATPTDVGGVGAVIDISAEVSSLLPWLLVLGGIGSQLSASVSNVAGGGSLLVETVGERLKPRASYLLIIVPAIALTWLTDINQVISLASRAFAAFYALQCVIGIRLLQRQPAGSTRARRIAGFLAMSLFMLFIAIFSIPT